jgi:hypothetical protein
LTLRTLGPVASTLLLDHQGRHFRKSFTQIFAHEILESFELCVEMW